jgi:hypothetical protein
MAACFWLIVIWAWRPEHLPDRSRHGGGPDRSRAETVPHPPHWKIALIVAVAMILLALLGVGLTTAKSAAASAYWTSLVPLLLSLFSYIDFPRLKQGVQKLRQTWLREAYDEMAPAFSTLGQLIGKALHAQGLIALCNAVMMFLALSTLGVEHPVLLGGAVFVLWRKDGEAPSDRWVQANGPFSRMVPGRWRRTCLLQRATPGEPGVTASSRAFLSTCAAVGPATAEHRPEQRQPAGVQAARHHRHDV